MKKTLACILLALMLLAGCARPMTLDTVVDEPNFKGTVAEVSEGAVLVRVDEGEEAHKSSDLISVSLDVQLKDSMTDFAVGDVVRVYFDGTIAESYPAQVNTVYAITLVEPAPA